MCNVSKKNTKCAKHHIYCVTRDRLVLLRVRSPLPSFPLYTSTHDQLLSHSFRVIDNSCTTTVVTVNLVSSALFSLFKKETVFKVLSLLVFRALALFHSLVSSSVFHTPKSHRFSVIAMLSVGLRCVFTVFVWLTVCECCVEFLCRRQ